MNCEGQRSFRESATSVLPPHGCTTPQFVVFLKVTELGLCALRMLDKFMLSTTDVAEVLLESGGSIGRAVTKFVGVC